MSEQQQDGAGGVATTGGPRRVVLKRDADKGGDCGVTVRRIKGSKWNAVACAAKFRVNDDFSKSLFAELMVRASIVDAPRLTDADDGTPVKFELAFHADLGRIASPAVYDALSGEDITAILTAASGGLSEEQGKN